MLFKYPKVVLRKDRRGIVELKKIQKGAFWPLKPGECRILYIRHGNHKNNITFPEDVKRLRRQGKALAEAGLKITAGLSSPAPRALTAVFETMVGTGQVGYIDTDRRLANLKAEAPELRERIKKEAEKTQMSPDEYLFGLIRSDQDVRNIMYHRAAEGAEALRDFAQKHLGETVIVGSHQASRMEISIAFLENPNTALKKPDILLEPCQIVELVKVAGRPPEIYYLEPPQ